MFWQTVVNNWNPKLKLQVNNIKIEDLVDTGNYHLTKILEFRMATSKGVHLVSRNCIHTAWVQLSSHHLI